MKRDVLLDATVIISLADADELAQLRSIPQTAFHITDSVEAEILLADQKAVLRVEIEEGAIIRERVEELSDLEIYSQMQPRLGAGEASCLLLGKRNGWRVASDDGSHPMPMWRDRTVTAAGMMTTRMLRMSIKMGALVTDPALAGGLPGSKKRRRRRRAKTSAKPSPVERSSGSARTSPGAPQI